MQPPGGLAKTLVRVASQARCGVHSKDTMPRSRLTKSRCTSDTALSISPSERYVIKVYGQPPSRATRVIWMLEEMNLPYETRSVDFMKRMEDTDFLEVSPTGSFPAVRDGDVRVMESCAIVEYLGAKYGPTPLAPS